MKKLILLAAILIYGSPYAQTTKLIFGPRDGDNAGIKEAYRNGAFDLELWVRTAPDINIIYMHLVISTNNLYIQDNSDIEIELYYPLDVWDLFIYYEHIDDPLNEGYIIRSILTIKDDPSFPEPEDGISTDGEWWLIATFKMAVTDEFDGEIHCDSFIEGFHPTHGGPRLVSFPADELDPSTYEMEYACISVIENECIEYSLGDYNGNGDFNIADVIASFSKLQTGTPDAALLCECPPGSGVEWATAMDVNSSCTFNIADVIAAFSKLATGSPDLTPCDYCPPLE